MNPKHIITLILLSLLPTSTLANTADKTTPDNRKTPKNFFAQGYQAQWVSQTQPKDYETYRDDGDEYFDVAPNDTITISVRLKNTGANTWYSNQNPQATTDNEISFATFKDPYTTSAPFGLGYDDIYSTDFGKSYFKNQYWLSDYRIGSLVEQSVAPGETGTLQMNFTIPADCPSGRYREDISSASGPYWIHNPTNGDPNKVMHIWVGFDVYRTTTSSFMDNKGYVKPKNFIYDDKKRDIYIDGQQKYQNLGNESYALSLSIPAGKHWFVTDPLRSKQVDFTVEQDTFQYLILYGTDTDPQLKLFSTDIIPPNDETKANLDIFLFMPEDGIITTLSNNNNNEKYTLINNQLNKLRNIAPSDKFTLIYSYNGENFGENKLTKFSTSKNTFTTLSIFGNDKKFLTSWVINRNFDESESASLGPIVPIFDKATDLYTNGQLRKISYASGDQYYFFQPWYFEAKLFDTGCNPTSCPALKIYRPNSFPKKTSPKAITSLPQAINYKKPAPAGNDL
ncbi:MAG: hypothetical protein WCP97_07960 [bacterium]